MYNKISIMDSIDKIVGPKGESILYRDFVATLIKPFDDPRLELAHAAMGVTGEAGELCDAIKRHAIYGKEVDIDNIIEELGDLEFYMQDVRNKYNISRYGILCANAEKLGKRYKELTYSDEAAIARDDKISEDMLEKAYGIPDEHQIHIGSNLSDIEGEGN